MANIMGFIILAIIAVVFFGAVIGTIADYTIGKQDTGNVTGATSALLGLLPIVVVIGVMIGLLGVAGLKVTGKV